MPLTGEAAAFGSVGPGAKAYFDYVNAKGGVHGRKIEYRFYDDAYNPAQTVQLTRKLVEQDRVFAIFNALGTANNLAVREYLNARKVPQLFAGDGSQQIGRSSARYPWTMGFLHELSRRGRRLRKEPREDADRGRRSPCSTRTRSSAGHAHAGSPARSPERGRGSSPRSAYELTGSDVTSQVARLKSSGADTLMLFATPKFIIQAVVATKSSAGSRRSTSPRSRSSRGSWRSLA